MASSIHCLLAESASLVNFFLTKLFRSDLPLTAVTISIHKRLVVIIENVSLIFTKVIDLTNSKRLSERIERLLE